MLILSRWANSAECKLLVRKQTVSTVMMWHCSLLYVHDNVCIYIYIYILAWFGTTTLTHSHVHQAFHTVHNWPMQFTWN